MRKLQAMTEVPCLSTGVMLKSYMVCRWCGIGHKHVEAAGWWHCPNPTCSSPGASHWRRKMPSCVDINEHRHTVNPEDVIAAGLERLMELERNADPELQRAIHVGIAYWHGDEAAFDRNRARWEGIGMPTPEESQAPARMRFARIAQELLEDDQ